jgi:hypothetical protein
VNRDEELKEKIEKHKVEFIRTKDSYVNECLIECKAELRGRIEMKAEIREWLEDNSDWDTCKDFDKEFEVKE